jgi:hypothetical protein
MSKRGSSPIRVSLAGLLLGGSLLLGACGGGSSAPNPPLAPAVREATHKDPVSTKTVAQQPMRGTGGAEINDDNPAAADSGKGTGSVGNPCKLVSQAAAQAIVGAPIATPQSAPLGPTCIYEPLHGSSSVTLAVESIDFARISSQIHKKTKAAIRGHTAFCGEYGHPTTFVLLTHDRVLNIGAPCAIGRRFATEALSHMQA